MELGEKKNSTDEGEKRKTLPNSQKLYAIPNFSCIDLAAMPPSTEPIEELS
jgi:hypothetical protein